MSTVAVEAKCRCAGLVFVALLISGCSADSGDEGFDTMTALAPGSPCPRPEVAASEPATAVTLIELPQLCRIVFRETGIVIRADPNGSHPDPGPQVVRDSKGRFYTSGASGFPFDIALWDVDGTFLRSFGGQGDGPGEMGGIGGVILQMDSRDRLHAKDARRQWTVFEPDQTFVRRVSSRALGERAFLAGGDAILENGSVITGNADLYVDSVFHFRLVDSTGAVVKRFSPKDRTIYDAFPVTSRVVAYGGGNTFWAGPGTYDGYSPMGYALEEWTLDGQHVRTLRRDVPWFPVSWPPPPPVEHGSGPMRRPQTPPTISQLRMVDDGVLLVIVVSSTGQGEAPTTPEGLPSPEQMDAMFETRIEAIDTRAAVVLASEQLAGVPATTVGNLLNGSPFSALTLEENLLPAVQIREIDLVTQ